MSKIHDPKIRKEVEVARRKGKTYRELIAMFGIPKSTLSYWFGETLGHPYNPEAQRNHLARIRVLAHASIQKRIANRAERIKQKVEKEIERYSLSDRGLQKMFLAGIYWAEGSKHEKVHGLKFANTDPKLSLIFLTLLRRLYPIDERRIRVRLHLHYYHNIKESRKFWSKHLNVPEDLFGKIYIKKRSKTKKFRKNFMGICFISYSDSDIRRELMELSQQFYGAMIEPTKTPL